MIKLESKQLFVPNKLNQTCTFSQKLILKKAFDNKGLKKQAISY